jgi:hypothetical protein
MTVREFDEWTRFCMQHPLPFELADIHAAMQTSLTINIHRSKDAPTANWVDYLVLKPRVAKPAPKLTMAQRMKAVTKS